MDLFDRVETPQQIKEDSIELAEKSASAFKTISEVSDMLGVPQHVLRFWESKFSQIKPLKRNGGRRYYRPQDVDTLVTIKHLLYKEGYTIKGARKAFGGKKLTLVDMDDAVPVQEPLLTRATEAVLFEDIPPAQVPLPPVVEEAVVALGQERRAELVALRGELLELRQMLSTAL